MKRLDAYELSVITSLSAVLQVATPTFPVSFIVGGWAFWVLRKPEVKAAFALRLRQTAAGPPREGLQPVEQAGAAPAGDRVKGPAAGLMATAVVNWVGLPFIGCGGGYFLIDLMERNKIGDGFPSEVAALLKFLVLPALPLVLASGLIFYGALKMRRLESRRLALVAAVLAVLVPPAYLIGWPFGLWALVVLTEPEVRAAFGRPKREQ
jgi:hypothetical protein